MTHKCDSFSDSTALWCHRQQYRVWCVKFGRNVARHFLKQEWGTESGSGAISAHFVRDFDDKKLVRNLFIQHQYNTKALNNLFHVYIPVWTEKSLFEKCVHWCGTCMQITRWFVTFLTNSTSTTLRFGFKLVLKQKEKNFCSPSEDAKLKSQNLLSISQYFGISKEPVHGALVRRRVHSDIVFYRSRSSCISKLINQRMKKINANNQIQETCPHGEP